MATKISAAGLVDWLAPHADPNAPEGQWGYIMGAYGQDPRKWSQSSVYYAQYKNRKDYSASQEAKALYWREHAEKVMDCNGCAEGYYLLKTGININARARNNYSTWCAGNNGKDMSKLPKIKGAAVFIYSSSAKAITHVGFLERPVSASNPNGDWWVLEARGVSYGLVRTKLNGRGWNRWGLMTLYFTYDEVPEQKVYNLGERTLVKGAEGADVKALQEILISLNYDLGKWGADGDFGDDTELAMKSFQLDNHIETTGKYDAFSHTTLTDIIKAQENEDDEPEVPAPAQPEVPKQPEIPTPQDETYTVTGNAVNLRVGPGVRYAKTGVVRAGDKLKAADMDGWKAVVVGDDLRFISAKYVK